MEAYVLQENDFRGSIQPQSGSNNLYSYSLWRDRSGEHLFDGVAGDLTDALDTVKAYCRFLAVHGAATTAE